MRRSWRRWLWTYLLALVGVAGLATPAWAQAQAPAKLEIRFFDVGQGDAIWIRSPTGKTILIDGGPPEAASSLAAKVSTSARGPLDLVILSHPHLDHLGGLPAVLRAVGAKMLVESGFEHPSQAYRELLAVVAQKGIALNPAHVDPEHPDEPWTIGIGGGAQLQVLWPRPPKEPFLSETRSDVNANSVVVRLVYGKTSVLFTGDSEEPTEQALVKRWPSLHADVLKVAHHGSRHSSTAAFLRAVSPKYAVISCGAGNDYGHPGKETLERLEGVGAQVFRTDLVGDVVATSDGETLELHPARDDGAGIASAQTRSASALVAPGAPPSAGEAGYIASKNAHVFHKFGCSAADHMKPENRVVFTTRADAAKDRRPAKDCNP